MCRLGSFLKASRKGRKVHAEAAEEMRIADIFFVETDNYPSRGGGF